MPIDVYANFERSPCDASWNLLCLQMPVGGGQQANDCGQILHWSRLCIQPQAHTYHQLWNFTHTYTSHSRGKSHNPLAAQHLDQSPPICWTARDPWMWLCSGILIVGFCHTQCLTPIQSHHRVWAAIMITVQVCTYAALISPSTPTAVSAETAFADGPKETQDHQKCHVLRL